MQQIGAFEAKTHFGQLLEKIAVGEQIIITKHGKRVAKLVPYSTYEEANSISNTIETMRKLRKKIGKIGITLADIKKMKEEGRK